MSASAAAAAAAKHQLINVPLTRKPSGPDPLDAIPMPVWSAYGKLAYKMDVLEEGAALHKEMAPLVEQLTKSHQGFICDLTDGGVLDTEEAVDRHMAKLAGIKKIIEEARAKNHRLPRNTSIMASAVYGESDEALLNETRKTRKRVREEIDAQIRK
jgi:hypothetical protein